MSMRLRGKVKENSATGGQGTLLLDGPPTGPFVSFVSAFGSGNKCYYVIEDFLTGEWEEGIGTVTSGTPDTLARTKVLRSTSAGNKINFIAGHTKNVYCDLLEGEAGLWTPTATPVSNQGWVTNTIYDNGFYRFRGNYLSVRFRISLSGVPNNASLNFGPPSGFSLTIDPSGGLRWFVGSVIGKDISTGDVHKFHVAWDTTDLQKFLTYYYLPTSGKLEFYGKAVTRSVPFVVAAGDEFLVHWSHPAERV